MEAGFSNFFLGGYFGFEEAVCQYMC